MCKCTHIPVIAAFNLLWVRLAELNFVFLGVIEFLDSVMRFWAAVTIWTLLVKRSVGDVWAYFAGVGPQRPPSVLFSLVVIETLFGVVLVREFALLGFKVVQVDKYYDVIVCAIHLLSF